MDCKIKWRPRALKELRKLPKEIAVRIVKKVDLCKDNPGYFLEKLTDDEGYKLRVGDYRAIIDIVEDGKSVIIVRYPNVLLSCYSSLLEMLRYENHTKTPPLLMRNRVLVFSSLKIILITLLLTSAPQHRNF